jgi:hypothetical protein
MDGCFSSHGAFPPGFLRKALPLAWPDSRGAARIGHVPRPSRATRSSSAGQDRPRSPDTGCRRTHSRSARTRLYARLLYGSPRSWRAGCAEPPCCHGRADRAENAHGHPQIPAAATGHGELPVPAMRRRQADGVCGRNGFCHTSGPQGPVDSGYRRGLEQHHATSLTNVTHRRGTKHGNPRRYARCWATRGRSGPRRYTGTGVSARNCHDPTRRAARSLASDWPTYG